MFIHLFGIILEFVALLKTSLFLGSEEEIFVFSKINLETSEVKLNPVLLYNFFAFEILSFARSSDIIIVKEEGKLWVVTGRGD